MKLYALKLKGLLPPDYLKILVEETGFTRNYISSVMNGRNENYKVLKAAAELASLYKADQEALKDVIDSLVKNNEGNPNI
jgi:hypothetical protein